MSGEQPIDYFPGWKPQDDICLVFTDKSGADRTDEQLAALAVALQEVAERYGFDLSQSGTKTGFERHFHRMHDVHGGQR